jgi:hypothetical protein
LRADWPFSAVYARRSLIEREDYRDLRLAFD